MNATVAVPLTSNPANRTQMRLAWFLLGASMFFSGASGLVAEYVLATVSTYILGNSIEQWSIIIASTMLCMGLGSLAQRHVSDDHLVEKFVVLEMALAVLIGFSPILIYGAFAFMDTHFPLVQYFFVGAIGFLIGFEIPLVSRILEPYVSGLKHNLSITFTWDYVGSFVGAIFWTNFLLPHLPLAEIGFVMAGCNLLVATATFAYFIRIGTVKKKRSLSALVATVTALLIFGGCYNQGWTMNLEQHLYEEPIIFAKTTRYQRLVVTKFAKLDEYRLYINGNLQFSSYDEYIYHEELVHPAMTLAAEHRHVLILGGGDGLALREVLKYPDVEDVTLVDLDPDMIDIAKNDPIFQTLNHHSFGDARVHTAVSEAVASNGRRQIRQETGRDKLAEKNKHYGEKEATESVATVDIITVDADRFLDQVDRRWDVVIIDFPDPNAVELAKLYSREFYQKVRHMLSEGGMVVVQSTSPYHAKEAYLCVMRTMADAGFGVLPYHDNVPSFGDWGWVLAWRAPVSAETVREHIKTIPEFSVPTRHLTPEVLQAALVFGKGWLDTTHNDINTLMRPVLLRYYEHDAWLVD